jgi:hypothetical protein
MGQFEAVASTMGIKWRGRPAWFLARSYHLAMMPGAKRKLRLLTDWNVQLLFGRDGSELGRLGHPPRLEDASGGGTPSGTDRRRRHRERRGGGAGAEAGGRPRGRRVGLSVYAPAPGAGVAAGGPAPIPLRPAAIGAAGTDHARCTP